MIWTYLLITAITGVVIAILGFILYRAKEPAERNKRIIEREYYKMDKK